MVADPMRMMNGPSSLTTSVMTNGNGGISPPVTMSSSSPLTISCSSTASSTLSTMSNSQVRIIGVILVSESLTAAGTDITTTTSDLTLGSVLLDSGRDYTGDELRQLMENQLASLPRNFSFLSKERWPIHSSMEGRVTSSVIINENNQSICVRHTFEKPRIGVVEDRFGFPLGFIFAFLATPLDSFRPDVDNLLKEIISHVNNPKLPDYAFVDNLGRPVLRNQEEKLSLVDLIQSGQNVHIIFLNPDPSSPSHSSNPPTLQPPPIKYISHSHSITYTERGGNRSQNNSPKRSIEPFLPCQSNYSDTVDGRTRHISQTSSISGAPLTPSTIIGGDPQRLPVEDIKRENSWKGRMSRKPSKKKDKEVKDKLRDKGKVQKTHSIMLSYARNEAAHHALQLKKELEKLGVSTYLDVHEISVGKDWMDSLNNAVSNCLIFVPLVTPLYGNTQWTNREVKLADLLNKKIVPINFLDSWPPDCLAIQFATTQYIAWLPEDISVDRSQLDGFNVWPSSAIKKIANDLSKEVPKDLKKGVTFSGSQKSIKSSAATPTDSIDGGAVNKNKIKPRLVVISGHPTDFTVISHIKSCLEKEGYSVWASCEDPSILPRVKTRQESDPKSTGTQGEDQIDHIPLPTIKEDIVVTGNPSSSSLQKSSSSGATDLRDISRALSNLKGPSTPAIRPTSLPPFGRISVSATASPDTEYISSSNHTTVSSLISQHCSSNMTENGQSSGQASTITTGPTKTSRSIIHRKKNPHPRLQRMHSDVGSSNRKLSPDKQNRLTTFAEKVSQSSVVIVVSSKSYFNSQTSKEQVYYCETRRKLIVVKADESKNPPWFSNLMGVELAVEFNSNRCSEEIKGFVKRMMDPSSTNTGCVADLHEVKIQYCVKMMKHNIEYLSTCVYVLGSTRLSNKRSEDICNAIGAALAHVKNVTLVTTGFMGAQDIVAKSFLKSLEDWKEKSNGNENETTGTHSRIVHVLPLKDDKDLNLEYCSQNEGGHFEPMSYGKTLFMGESVQERQAVIPRLLDTCILIEGDSATAKEAHDFIWNDHFVIPVMPTMDLNLPEKVFERPSGVDETAWSLLRSTDASPLEVAGAVVKVLLGVKQHIVDLKIRRKEKSSQPVTEKLSQLSVSTVTGRFSRKLRRSSKKKSSSSLTSSTASTPMTEVARTPATSVTGTSGDYHHSIGATVGNPLTPAATTEMSVLPVCETDADLSSASSDYAPADGPCKGNGFTEGWKKVQKMFKKSNSSTSVVVNDSEKK